MTAPKQRITADQFLERLLSPAGGLSEAGMRGRISMLKRMKSNLICEWHPILDILIGDYELELHRVESLREPPDPDEDVQDRDF